MNSFFAVVISAIFAVFVCARGGVFLCRNIFLLVVLLIANPIAWLPPFLPLFFLFVLISFNNN